MAGSLSLKANASIGATAGQASVHIPQSSQNLGNGIGLGSGSTTGAGGASKWTESMRPVQFGTITIPATQVKVSSGRKIVKHVYPYRPGQEVVDLGRQALTINVSAVFGNEPFLVAAFGEDLYPGRYEALLQEIHKGTSMELVHPVFGSLKASCESYSDTTQATELNTVRLELTFVEDNADPNVPIFNASPQRSAKESALLLDASVAGRL